VKSEKDQLIDFALYMLRRTSVAHHLPDNPREKWMRAPISGVRQAANDMLELVADLKPEEIAEIDAELNSLDIPTLTAMLDKTYRKFLSIESRNKVRNEDDWRILRALVETDKLNELQVENSLRLMAEFEAGNT
jgi:hypothetical protein